MDLVETLQDVGWSELEARVYLALVESAQPLTGYQTAKAARIARANVYPVIERLVRRGAVTEEPGDGAPRYRAVSFDVVARGHLASLEATLEAVQNALPSVKSAALLETGRGERAVRTHGLALIESARTTLAVGASAATVYPFAAALAVARERYGVEEHFGCFDSCPPPGCGVCRQPVPLFPGAFRPKGWLVIVGAEETLVAVGTGESAEFVRTNLAPIRETLRMVLTPRTDPPSGP